MISLHVVCVNYACDLLWTTPDALLNLPQDDANLPPQHWLNRWTLRRALRRMDAVSFVSREQARPRLEGGLLSGAADCKLMEGSSRFRLMPRAEVRARTGLPGDPVCLWVGRLNANKDPLTVLRGFALALAAMPNARLAMVYGTADLLSAVHRWLEDDSASARFFRRKFSWKAIGLDRNGGLSAVGY